VRACKKGSYEDTLCNKSDNACFYSHLQGQAVGSQRIEAAYHVEPVSEPEGIVAWPDAEEPAVLKHLPGRYPDMQAIGI